MDFFETVKKRGSYKDAFLSLPVAEADLLDILDAGIRAPSGYNMQTTSFVVVTEPALLKRIAALVPSPAVETAPVLILPVTEVRRSASGLSFETEDYACAAENILLAVAAKGYGAVLIDDGEARLYGNAGKLGELLCVPEGRRVRAVIPIGVPAHEVVQREKKPFLERVFFNRFG